MTSSEKQQGLLYPHVLILTQLFYPELVSSGQTLTELAEELSRRGADIEVLCGPPTILEDKIEAPR